MGPGGTISKTGLNDMDALQSPLTGMTVKKGTVNPQVDSKQLGTFTALNTPNQVQLQMQNQSILGQAQVTEIAGKNTDMLSTNPVLSKTVISSSSLLGSLNNTGKNNGKQVDGTKAATIPVNVGENSLGMMDAFQVKPILSSQEAVTIIDTVSSANKEKQAAILPKTPVADADVFANLLSQQGMKIENQTVTDVKSVPSQPVADPYHIASQIIDQAHLVAGAKNTEMIIQLKPEHLGELTFKVSVEGGVVSASFHSNNPEVRSIIESSLYQLKQEMFNQGLKVDNVGVYAGLGQFFSNGQQSRSNQQPVVKHQNKKTEEDFREALDATDSVGKVLNTTEVDYRA
jgi:flagellar hook-length control protein FliK